MTEALYSIAIVGSGRIGGNIGLRCAAVGHFVTFTYARDSNKLDRLAVEAGNGAEAGQPNEAAENADVIVLATPWDAVGEVLDPASVRDGAILIDATNQFGATGLVDLDGRLAAEINRERFAPALYAKAFNTLTSGFQKAEKDRRPEYRHAMFFGGEDGAKQAAAALIEAVGFVPVDLGGFEQLSLMEAPRRDGAVYGEAYRPVDARRIAEAAKTDLAEARQLARTLKIEEG